MRSRRHASPEHPLEAPRGGPRSDAQPVQAPEYPPTPTRLTAAPTPDLCRICGHPLHRFLTEAGLTIHDGHERTRP